MVLSAGIYGASQSWTANPESGFLLRYYWSNTSVCQKYSPRSQSPVNNSHYWSSSCFQSSNNSSESHKLNDHSKVRNFDKLLRAHIQDQFTLCKKCGSAHLFRKTCIWLAELLLYFLYDTRLLLEDTPVFNHPIVKAGSRSTEHTVCKEYCSHRRNRIWHNYA